MSAVPGAASRLHAARTAVAANVRNPLLRRAQLSFGAAFAGEWAVTVAIAVVAYEDGGAAAVGLVAFLRTLPAVVLVPLGGVFGDRLPRDRVLVAIGVLRTLATVAAAAVLWAGAPVLAAYALTIVQTVVFSLVRPVHSALLPTLCATPRELTGANVVRGLMDSLSVLIGPLLAALLLGVSSAAAVFAAAALLSAASTMLMLGVSYERLPSLRREARIVAEAAEGARAMLGTPGPRVLGLLTLVQTATRGAVSVLVVVVSIELLGAGEAGVGVLTSALGVGAVVGSVAVLLIGSGRRLAALMGAGVTLWGAPLVLAGALPDYAVVLAALAVIGAANALCDVGYYSLLARLIPDELLGRAMSVSESLCTLGVALGSILAPLAVDVLGVRGALVAAGLVAPAAVALGWRMLSRIDADMVVRDEEAAVLKGVELLGPLPVPAIDHLAARLTRVDAQPGDVVIREGDPGERFYVLVEGEVEVLRGGRPLRTMGPGEAFGEVALLRDSPRTATVRARTALRLYALDRRHFLATVSAYRASMAEAGSVVSGYLRRDEQDDGRAVAEPAAGR